jgi:hypothetical protein
VQRDVFVCGCAIERRLTSSALPILSPPSFLHSDVAEFAKKKNELKQKTSAALQVGREKQAGFATHSNKRKEREFANKFKAIV